MIHDIILNILTEEYKIDVTQIENFCNAVLQNDKDEIEKTLNKILPKMSYMDKKEAHFHGYIEGIFSMFLLDSNYIVYSNRESGKRLFDLMIKDKKFNIGIIIELKITKDDLEPGALKGLKQIEEKEYYLDLVNEGYKDIRKIAICFKGKKCVVR